MAVMAKKPQKKDRHKNPILAVRPHPMLRKQLEALAERNAVTITAEVITAIRERLERNGFWPPPQD